MSLQRVAAGLLAAVLAGWAVTASAAGEYGRSGPYLGAGAVYAFENIDEPGAPYNVKSIDNSWGYTLKGGYRFHQMFALEAEWEQWLSFDYNAYADIPLPSSSDFDGWLATINAKGFFSDGPIQPFVLAGAGLMGGKDKARLDSKAKSLDETALGLRFGAGLDIYLARNWAITAEGGYVMGTSSLSHYDLIPISVGVLYRFY